MAGRGGGTWNGMFNIALVSPENSSLAFEVTEFFCLPRSQWICSAVPLLLAPRYYSVLARQPLSRFESNLARVRHFYEYCDYLTGIGENEWQ